jgi:hypothetical protein
MGDKAHWLEWGLIAGLGAEVIRRWRCAACGNRFSARRHTPLYRVKTPSRRVAEVMTAMAEGVDTATASRIFNHHPNTIAHWVQRGGQHGQRQHEHYFRQIRSGHLQVDELVTKVKHHPERVWVWTGIDAETKVLLALHLGRRTRSAAAPGRSLKLLRSHTIISNGDGLTTILRAFTTTYVSLVPILGGCVHGPPPWRPE